MDKFELNDEILGFTATPGHLLITNQQGQVIHLREQPLNTFEEFYQLWNLAMAVAGTETFINSWVYNQEFRQTIERACHVIGLEEPGLLLIRQLEALLLTYEWPKGGGAAGLLFKMHCTYPKLPSQSQAPVKTLATSLQTALGPVILMLQESLRTQSLTEKLPSIVGLYLGLCILWLLSRIPVLSKIQVLFSVSEKQNGSLTLRAPTLIPRGSPSPKVPNLLRRSDDA